MHNDSKYTPATGKLGDERVPVDEKRAARLRWAREKADFETAEAAIQRFGWVAQTYRSHENASRGIRNDRILIYAKAFGVRRDWLLSGLGTPKDVTARVRISGLIGEFGKVDDTSSIFRKEDESTSDAEPPPIEGDYLAYRVAGDHNYPALFNTDIVYTTQFEAPDQVLGRQCVAKLADGSRRICILGRGSATGLFLLMSINASPIPDAPVVEAAPVVWIKRG